MKHNLRNDLKPDYDFIILTGFANRLSALQDEHLSKKEVSLPVLTLFEKLLSEISDHYYAKSHKKELSWEELNFWMLANKFKNESIPFIRARVNINGFLNIERQKAYN